MSSVNLIDEDTDLRGSSPLALLQEQLADLLLIHWQTKYGHKANSRSECPSLYLIKSQYASGEKSAEKSSMRFALRVSPEDREHVAAETLSLEFIVRSTPCWDH